MKKIKFTPHAEEKLTRLKDLGITKDKVIQTIENPNKCCKWLSGT